MKTRILPLLISILLILSACGAPAASSPVSDVLPDSVSSGAAEAQMPEEVSSAEPPEETGPETTEIDLNNSDTQITGPGAAFDSTDNTVTISEPGIYRLSGTLDPGRVLVETKGGVELILDGAAIASPEYDALFCIKAESMKLTLADNSENELTSGTQETYDALLQGEMLTFPEITDQEDAEDQEVTVTGADLPKGRKAALYSKPPLYITGAGSLTVSGFLQNGIQARGGLLMDADAVSVTAANDGIKAKAAIEIDQGSYTVVSQGDAITTDGDLLIQDGAFQITTGGGADAAAMKTEFGFGPPPGFWEDDNFDQDDLGPTSHKGLKAEGLLTVTGGDFQMDTADDCVHSGSAAEISGGTMHLRSGDDGVHADDTLAISGGSVQVEYCYEGIEAIHISVSGGDVSVTTTDDGFNASGGWNDSPSLEVSGGSVYVNAEGDGMDSNGDMIFTGGSVYVDGPPNGMNAAIDIGSEIGGVFLVHGGTVTAIGMSGMIEVAEQESEQVVLTMVFSQRIPAETEVTVTDSTGKEVARFITVKQADSVVLSTPELQLGESYTFAWEGGSETLEATSQSSTNRRRGFGGPPGR